MAYRPRVIDQVLSRLVQDVPAVALVGAKAVGKTESARRLAATEIDLADPDRRAVVQADRAAALAAPTPVLIDEWQYDPDTWEAMRSAVDRDPRPGRFLLTGSVNPRGVRVHSGAGRVVRVRMRPLSLAERGYPSTVSLGELWHGHAHVAGESEAELSAYASEIVASGFPAIRFAGERARIPLLEGYVESAVEHEAPELGFTPRRPDSLLQWLRAYAAASSTTAAYTAIADAIPEEARASRATTNAYRDVLSQLWLLDPVPALPLGRNRLKELGRLPKHQVVDPGLVTALLGLDNGSLLGGRSGRDAGALRDGPLFGTLMESLATLCVRVYASALDLKVSHIRTARGDHEVDLVVHAADGRLLAFEVKLGATPDDRDVRHLNWLADRMGADLVDRVVLTTGKSAYRRRDGIAVVPLALLGP
ncbi:MAG TPA: DUF4143 domain-containing protein [Candidatus Ruania gallistercoris]|uniref:DUF4143 domain-containing protein n=1 Tax=Candidatus Ruania gallistercoris TaxID=2838746 RepID=A0A9D2J2U7_9MICO|nr:DUF4143 domain-containing protein [Candidatus Ruania gallistercoris]